MTTATSHPTDLPKIELKRKATKDVPLYVIDSVQEVYDQARRYAANLLPADDLDNAYDENVVNDTEKEVRLELTKAHDTIVGHIDAINESPSEDDTSAIDNIVEMEYVLRHAVNTIN